jgi:hypothetical protein
MIRIDHQVFDIIAINFNSRFLGLAADEYAEKCDHGYSQQLDWNALT